MKTQRVASVVVVLALFCATDAYAASFRGLGGIEPHPSFLSMGEGISGNGLFVTGNTRTSNGGEAFIWTESGGMVPLGDLPGGPFASTGIAVSNDGLVGVGFGNTENGNEAFRWDAAIGMINLGNLGDLGTMRVRAEDVSDNGQVIIGSSSGSNLVGLEAYRWTESDGMVGLGYMDDSGIAKFSTANAVSANGLTIVGESSDNVNSDYSQAYRWTESDGMVGIGKLPGAKRSRAHGVSADGSVIVGASGSVSGLEAFRWTQETGMVGLGKLPGGHTSLAYDVSADGSRIIGFSDAEETNAFVWDELNGMRSIVSALCGDTDNLIEEVIGWQLTHAMAISDDGTTIVGRGLNPAGQHEAWLAHLDDLSTHLSGDTNRDGLVNIEDLNNVRNNFGGTGLGDTTGDCLVNIDDLNAVRNNFGAMQQAAVPEPSAFAITLALTYFVALQRRRS